jgi:1,4-alpha-glucan branching enzyme
VDGFRHDATICIRKGHKNCWLESQGNMDGIVLLQQMNKQSLTWNVINIAEDLQSDSWVTTPVSSGGLGFDGQWDDSGYYQLHDILSSKDDGSRDTNKFASVSSFIWLH